MHYIPHPLSSLYDQDPACNLLEFKNTLTNPPAAKYLNLHALVFIGLRSGFGNRHCVLEPQISLWPKILPGQVLAKSGLG